MDDARVVAAGWARVVPVGKNEQATPRGRPDLLASGVSRRALAGGQWESPHRGVHRRETVKDPVRQRILDAAAVMPAGGAIGGWAAAYLHGAAHLDGRRRKTGAQAKAGAQAETGHDGTTGSRPRMCWNPC